ncbi:hypothetical protein BDR03DRAFT_981513 [Suillus americanus]|nr:hypothetical protein BDR03DRAFT_981513 [Suillus americanus]
MWSAQPPAVDSTLTTTLNAKPLAVYSTLITTLNAQPSAAYSAISATLSTLPPITRGSTHALLAPPSNLQHLQTMSMGEIPGSHVIHAILVSKELIISIMFSKDALVSSGNDKKCVVKSIITQARPSILALLDNPLAFMHQYSFAEDGTLVIHTKFNNQFILHILMQAI